MSTLSDESNAVPSLFRKRLGRVLGTAGTAGAAVVSAFILIQTTGPDAHIKGCGGGGCSGAWASKWSSLFGMPVAAGALMVYLSLFALLVWRPRGDYARGPVFRSWGLIILAVPALLSILYFAGIQALVLQQFCKWCLLAHASGLVALTGVFLLKPWSPDVGEYCMVRPRPVLCTGIGVLLFAAFAGLQAIDPGHDTHRVVQGPELRLDAPNMNTLDTGESRLPLAPDLTVSENEVLLPDGTRVARGHFPTLGNADSDRVVYKLFDYTCDSCRDMHKDLEEVWPGLPVDAALVLIPCPLNRSCHPGLPPSVPNHANACELARIALALWRAAPEHYSDYHRWAFANRPQPELAHTYAATLAGEDALDAAMSDPEIDADIALAVRLFASAGGPRMPKLFLPDGQVVVGVTRDTGVTRRLLERALRD